MEQYFYPDHRCWQVRLNPNLLKDSTYIIEATEEDICMVYPHRRKCSFPGAPLKPGEIPDFSRNSREPET